MGVFGSFLEGGARRRGSRARAVLASLVLVSSAVPIFAATTGSSAAAPVTSPTYSNKTLESGFPTWFEDVNGVRVEACLDPADGNCLAPLTGPGYNSDLALDFPANFPEEFFYSAADSEPIQVADPACAAGTGTLSVHLALEAAFINGGAVQGDQMVFGRIRIVAKDGAGLCGDTWYTFRTPYGDVTIKTEPDGTILGGVAAANTIDVGCFPSPVKPCNFDESLAAPVLQYGLLTQSPVAVNGLPVDGYLGNGTFDLIAGGRDDVNSFEVYKWPEGTGPAQGGLDVPCVDCGAPLASTANFQLLAKVAGPLEADKDIIDFGGQVAGTPSAPLTSTILNLGSGPLGLDDTTVESVVLSDPSGVFAVGPDACTGVVVPRSTSCGISVTYTPSAVTGVADSAFLTITSAAAPLAPAGVPRSVTVELRGTAINAGDAPALDIDPETVLFPATRITTVSDPLTVTFTNSGSAPLFVAPGALTGDSAAFLIADDTCSAVSVPAGQTCTIALRFKPVVRELNAAVLDLVNNTGVSRSIALNGSGTGGVATESPTLDPEDTFPDWYQDEHGVRVGQCDDPANVKCIAAPLPVAGAPRAFPGNYPDEWFYYIMQSDAVTVVDDTCVVDGEVTTVTGDLSVEVAAEAAFLGPIVRNGGITFGRIRLVASALCPDTSYRIVHPYGVLTLTTNERGDIKPNMSTIDVGCAAAPCDFHEAISAVVFESFLTQANRTPGYLGDPITPGTVTGAPNIVDGEEFNQVTVAKDGSPDQLIGQTDLFLVSGRLVGPMVANPAAMTFDPATMADELTFTQQPVEFRNSGNVETVTLSNPALTVDGFDAASFGIVDAGTCVAGTELIPGDFCTAIVEFHPVTPGQKQAELTLHHSGKNDPLAVSLSGLSNSLPDTAALSPSVPTVKFIDRHLLNSSELFDLHLSNVGGQAPLAFHAITLSDEVNYRIYTSSCVLEVPGDIDTYVQRGQDCIVTLQFIPTVAGPLPATLHIESNAVTGPLDVSLSGRGSEAVPAQSATLNSGGFPDWIQDNNGVRMESCLVNDGHCVLLPDATFNPGQPVVFPSNYPTESFYSIADSDLVAVPPHVCRAAAPGVTAITAAGGDVSVRIATEAAFTTPSPTAGATNMFNRLRILGNGLCPNWTYTFTHPYGTTPISTDANGAIRAKAGTLDNPSVLASFPVTSFLRWDPNVAPAAPTGYLGSYGTFHRITGGTYRPDGVNPVNYFAVALPGGGTASTDRFALAARTAGPVVVNPTSWDFGNVEINDVSLVRTFSVLNLGIDPATVTGVEITGSTQFALRPGGTCGVAMVRDASCTVNVQFLPVGVPGARSASLVIHTNTSKPTITVPLTGTAIPLLTPVLTVTPATFNFGNVQVTTASTTTVTVANGGTGVLKLSSLGFTATSSTDFTWTGSGINPCAVGTNLGAAASCTVTVTFRPSAKLARSATLTVGASDFTSSLVVTHADTGALTGKTSALSGTGIQATISASATSLTISARSTETKNVKVTLTNTGNANFSLAGAPAIDVVDQVLGSNARLKFTPAPTHNCNNILPGKTCQVTINFTPGAGTVNQTYSVYVWLYGNATNLGAAPNGLRLSVVGTRAR